MRVLAKDHTSSPKLARNRTSAATQAGDDPLLRPGPPRFQAHLQLQPVTRTTVVTTTTTSTLSFPPLAVQRNVKGHATKADEEDQLEPLNYDSDTEALDERLYPLARALLPRSLHRMRFNVGPIEAHFSEQSDTGADASNMITARTDHRVLMTAEEPPRKRAKAEHTWSASLPGHSSRRPSNTPQSPTLLPRDADALNLTAFSPLSGEGNTDDFLRQVNDNLATSLDLAVLVSLTSLTEQFKGLAPDMQSYVLFSLLKHSPVSVLQHINSIIEPALKRDFLSDLPPELVTTILTYLDGHSLCVASSISKNWRKIIRRDGRAWLSVIKAEGLFEGNGSEERDALRLLGCPMSTKEGVFFHRWAAGIWKANFDQAEAARPTAHKIASVAGVSCHNRGHGLCRSPGAIDSLSSPSLDDLQSMVAAYKERSVHPMMSLYIYRYLRRRRWMSIEPLRSTFSGHSQSTVTCLQFDRNRIVSASDEHLINVFQTNTGKTLARLEGHEGGVWALHYFGDILVSGSTDRTVRIWDLATFRNTHTFVGHTSTVRCLQVIEPQNVNPDVSGPPIWEPPYPIIITGSRDCTLRSWRLPSPSRDAEHHPYVPLSPTDDGSQTDSIPNPFQLKQFTGHRQAVRALAASGRLVVSGSYDYTVRVWDLLDGECKFVLLGHTGKVYSVVLDALHQRCASGSMDGSVRLWSTQNGECLRHMDGHTSLVGLLGLSSDHLISAAADATLRLWSPRTGECKAILSAHAGAITCFQHDQYKVISGSDGTLKLWDIRNGLFLRDLLDGLSGVWQCAFDDRYCVAAVQRNNRSEFEVLDFGDPLEEMLASNLEDGGLSRALSPGFVTYAKAAQEDLYGSSRAEISDVDANLIFCSSPLATLRPKRPSNSNLVSHSANLPISVAAARGTGPAAAIDVDFDEQPVE